MPNYGSGFTGGRESIIGSEKTKRKYKYSDIDFVFKPSPLFLEKGLSGDIARKFDAEAIKQSVRNIVLTCRYERPWKPNMGSNIRKILFENIGAWDTFDLREKITDDIERYEPRVTIDAINIQEDEVEQSVNIELDYFMNPITEESRIETVTVTIQTQRIR